MSIVTHVSMKVTSKGQVNETFPIGKNEEKV